MDGRERKLDAWQCPTLTWGDPTLPSALSVFTSECGMGSGGSRSLWPPGKPVGVVGVRLSFPDLENGKPGSQKEPGLTPVFPRNLTIWIVFNE